MFQEERHQQICALIEQRGRVTVSDLASRFEVTEDCIRKDLKLLAAEGRCRKVYGGATRIERSGGRTVGERLNLFQPEKQAIALKAIELVKPNQTLYLDISTTALHLARLLAQGDMPLTVISPMVDILTTMGSNPNVTAICPGGTMQPDLNGFVGALAIDALDPHRFDIAFLGAYSIDVDTHAVATFDAEDGLLKRAAIERAGQSYLLCESRKFEAFGTYRFASLSDFDALVCDDQDQESICTLREADVDVL